MIVMTIAYIIGIIAVGMTCYHLGYWSGWDKGMQDSTNQLMDT